MERSRGSVLRMVVALLTLPLGACTESFTELNRNPNAPTDAPSEFLLSTALETGTQQLMGGLALGAVGNWVQHTARIEYGWDDRYDVRPETYNGAWNGIYAGPLADLQTVIERESAAGAANRSAVPRIMRVWILHQLTDMWGDIPYSEALQGAANVTPGYDPQEEVYRGLVRELQEARAALRVGEPGFGPADIVYGGDVAGWQRFAASLQLRIGMRMSEADAQAARDAVQDALAAGVFEAPGHAALFRWLDTDNNANPWWSGTSEAPGGNRISDTMVETLKELNDPRLPVYARPNEDGEFIGQQNGLRDGHGIPFLKRSFIGEAFVRRRNRPSVLLSYDEVLFLRSEAASRGWGQGDVGALYAQGVAEALRRVEVNEASIESYLTQPDVVYDPARGRDQIHLQKWIALFGNSMEAWAEWRRTGVPHLVAGPDNVTDGQLPRRMPYSTDEQSLNNVKLQAAVSNQGGADITARLWFDRRP